MILTRRKAPYITAQLTAVPFVGENYGKEKGLAALPSVVKTKTSV